MQPFQVLVRVVYKGDHREREKVPRPFRQISMREATRQRNEFLESLFIAEYANLKRFAFLLVLDVHTADDLVMEAFARSFSRFRTIAGFDWPAGYLRMTIVNLARTRGRRAAVERKLRDVLPVSPAPENVDHSVDLVRALKSLGVRDRACIAMRYLEDLPEREIARLLDEPLGTVKSRLSRARRKLEAQMTIEELV